MRLVLFDIDGTLLWTDGAGRRAIHTALTEFFGTTGRPDYWFDGKTDRQIVRDLMRHEGHTDQHIDAQMTAVFERYVERLRVELDAPGHVARPLPGVHALLDALEARDDVVLGVLTGNLAEGAAAKLSAVGIDPRRFRIGAFGSDHEHRPALPAIAQRRAAESLGVELAGPDLVVIGDTPADIECARSVDARAIGVATGRYPVDELERHGAVAVFRDLTDTDAVVRVIVDA